MLYGAPPIQENPDQISQQVLKVSPDKLNTVSRKKLSQEEIQRIKDIRAQIKNLREGTMAKVKELSKSKDEADMKKVEALKFETELKVMKLRREIAVIRGNEKLVKEFDEAIDHIEHPEKYRKPPVKVERSIPDGRSGQIEEKKVR